MGLRPCSLHQEPCPWPCTSLESFKGLPSCDLRAPMVLAVGKMEKLIQQCCPGVFPLHRGVGICWRNFLWKPAHTYTGKVVCRNKKGILFNKCTHWLCV